MQIGASYSQFHEDVVIATALGSYRRSYAPCMIDVGANNGQSWSNSRLFGEIGWKLILIEPLPKFANDCRLFYSGNDNVVVIESAISSIHGMVDFFATDEPERDLLKMGSSLSQEGIPFGLKSRKIAVKTEPLDHVLASQQVPENYGVLSVDAEGHDLEVLKTANLARFRPAVICVEMIYGDPRYTDIDAYLVTHQYRYVASTPSNGIYVNGRDS